MPQRSTKIREIAQVKQAMMNVVPNIFGKSNTLRSVNSTIVVQSPLLRKKELQKWAVFLLNDSANTHTIGTSQMTARMARNKWANTSPVMAIFYWSCRRPWLHFLLRNACCSSECLLILIGAGIAVGDQRNDGQHDEGHDADHGTEIVILLVHGQLVQPGDKQISGACGIAQWRRIAAGQQVNDVEVVSHCP